MDGTGVVLVVMLLMLLVSAGAVCGPWLPCWLSNVGWSARNFRPVLVQFLECLHIR